MSTNAIDTTAKVVVAAVVLIPCVIVGKYVGMVAGGIAAGGLGVMLVNRLKTSNVKEQIENAYHNVDLRIRERFTRSSAVAEVVPAEPVEENMVPEQRPRRRRSA